MPWQVGWLLKIIAFHFQSAAVYLCNIIKREAGDISLKLFNRD